MSDIRFEVVKKIVETNFITQSLKNVSKFNSSSPPSVFVGSKLKYPLVNVGILSPLEHDDDAWVYADEPYWAENNFEITDVIKLRDSLLNSRFQSRVHDARMNKRFVELAKEIRASGHRMPIWLLSASNINEEMAKDAGIEKVFLKYRPDKLWSAIKNFGKEG